MKVVWVPEAQQDRADVWDYIAADNPRAAAQMDALFSDAVVRLADHPKLGQVGKIPGTRELIPLRKRKIKHACDTKPHRHVLHI